MKPGYVPDTGDIVWLHFDPQAGHEQAGHRPALVLSPVRYNGPRGMMICCPMTSRIKGYAFEVVESADPPSVVLADPLSEAGRAPRLQCRDVSAPLKQLLDAAQDAVLDDMDVGATVQQLSSAGEQ